MAIGRSLPFRKQYFPRAEVGSGPNAGERQSLVVVNAWLVTQSLISLRQRCEVGAIHTSSEISRAEASSVTDQPTKRQQSSICRHEQNTRHSLYYILLQSQLL